MARPVLASVMMVLFGVVAGACVEEVEPDPSAEAEHRLRVAGHDLAVVDCVLGLARRDLDRGPLTDVELAELADHCLRVDAANGPGTVGPDDKKPAALATADVPWTLGDDQFLDRLWTECADGDGSACDRLFEAAPPGSDYESFGLTCGDRPDVLHCAELNAPED